MKVVNWIFNFIMVLVVLALAMNVVSHFSMFTNNIHRFFDR